MEIAQGKAIADAAVAAGAYQIIWSSLPSITEMTGGKITSMKHFDGKAEVEAYIRTLDIKSMFFMPGWFMQNHLSLIRPKKVRTEVSTKLNKSFSDPAIRQVTVHTCSLNRGDLLLVSL
jgi:uncharacterized protein YbjT (DUF2867 family)